MSEDNTTNIQGDLNISGDFVGRDKHVTINNQSASTRAPVAAPSWFGRWA